MSYRGKEEIHSEIELTIYQLKWYIPTNIISLALLVLRPNIVLLLTEILQNFICSPSHHRTSTAQGFFESGSRRKAAAHMRPAKYKNTFGPLGIPPMWAPQTPGNKTANNW